MDGPKRTPWFPGKVKPVREGVYERKSETGALSFWDGKAWSAGFDVVEELPSAKQYRSGWQSEKWRGLAADPKAAA